MITVSTSSRQEAQAAIRLLKSLPPGVQWKVFLLGREVAPDETGQHRLPGLGQPHPASRPSAPDLIHGHPAAEKCRSSCQVLPGNC